MIEREPISLPPDTNPILVVVIDTEEEFDWDSDFDRWATSVHAMSQIPLAQEVFDAHGVRPVYVVDYPVATQKPGIDALKDLVSTDRAELGAHLHPWVSPPLTEELTRENSFAGNLSKQLEKEKIELLVKAIDSGFGLRPTCYKAGRYGFGPNTAGILDELGFEIDLSACPPFDFSAESGPDYSDFSCQPYWFGPRNRLLGIPSTGAYVGFLSKGGHRLYRWVNSDPWCRLKIPGIVDRLGALSRLHLSPEGYTPKELRHLTLSLLHRGIRIFVYSFHSPSLMPGCTPYVRSESDVVEFVAGIDEYLKFFVGTLRGRCMTARELREFLLTATEKSKL